MFSCRTITAAKQHRCIVTAIVEGAFVRIVATAGRDLAV